MEFNLRLPGMNMGMEILYGTMQTTVIESMKNSTHSIKIKEEPGSPSLILMNTLRTILYPIVIGIQNAKVTSMSLISYWRILYGRIIPRSMIGWRCRMRDGS